MKRIQIIKNGIVTNQIEDFEEVVTKWLADGLANHWFGRPAQYEEVIDPETNEFKQVLVAPAEEFQVVGPIDITEEVEQKRINAEVEQYLNETDKWIIREFETGKPCPPEIKAKRAELRPKHKKVN